MKDKEMQLQLKLKEFELQKVATPTTPTKLLPATAPSFDISQQVRLVPQFTEQEVDIFFSHFEKVATNTFTGHLNHIQCCCRAFS